MTQINRNSEEITTLVGPVYMDDSMAGTASTAAYPTHQFQSALAYVDIANANALGIWVSIECSPDNTTFYRGHQGDVDATVPVVQHATHVALWTGLMGGSSLMLTAAPIGAYTRASVEWVEGQGDVSIRLGFKS